MDHSTEINEALLRSMPASAYMDPTQLAFFRARLETMHRENAARICSPLDLIDESPMMAADPNDQASLHEQQAAQHKERERLVHQQRELLAAIARISDPHGGYGYCEDTGEEIGIDRLLAMPAARYCLDAQAQRERRSRMGGG